MSMSPCAKLYEKWVELVRQLDDMLKRLPETHPEVLDLYDRTRAAEQAWRDCLEQKAIKR